MNATQKSIMYSVVQWGKVKKEPIPFDRILRDVVKMTPDLREDSIKYHVRSLVKKGYLRKACTRSKSLCYVQLRGI